jgi:hypothetical protein
MTFVLSFIFPPLLLMGQNLTVRDRLSVKWAYCHVQTGKFEGGAPVEFISFLSQPQLRLRLRVDASRRGSPSRFADSVTGAAGFPALGTA